MLKSNRPRFLNLIQIRLPMTGLISIFHRVSGVLLFLFLPFLLYLLQLSLNDAMSFDDAQAILSGWPARIAGLFLLWLFAYHLFAGVRVILIDMDLGSDLVTARRSALLVLISALLLAVGVTVL